MNGNAAIEPQLLPSGVEKARRGDLDGVSGGGSDESGIGMGRLWFSVGGKRW